MEPEALDELIDLYQSRVGPRNGAKVVARAWTDPDFARWLFTDATAAIASLGYQGRQGEHLVALEQTAGTHHVVVCSLCSCYPWPVLGLPPTWYKSAPYRSSVVRDPRGVLGEQPHWLYTVVFDAPDLWPDAEPRTRVSVDAWEPYLTSLAAPADFD